MTIARVINFVHPDRNDESIRFWRSEVVLLYLSCPRDHNISGIAVETNQFSLGFKLTFPQRLLRSSLTLLFITQEFVYVTKRQPNV